MVGEELLSSTIRSRMNINNNQIVSTASQPSNSNTHNETSISRLIWPGILPSSQPLLAFDQSRVETVTRNRER